MKIYHIQRNIILVYFHTQTIATITQFYCAKTFLQQPFYSLVLNSLFYQQSVYQPSIYFDKRSHLQLMYVFRSSRPEVFCKKGALRNFPKFTGKYLCQSLFFKKVAGLMTATFLKKGLWHKCVPASFLKISKNTFYIGHLWWLLLYVMNVQISIFF